MLDRVEGWLAILNRADQVSLWRSQLSNDLEVKYIHANICRKNIPSRGNKQYNSPEVGVTGIFENSNEAGVAATERARERMVKAEVREAKRGGGAKCGVQIMQELVGHCKN